MNIVSILKMGMLAHKEILLYNGLNYDCYHDELHLLNLFQKMTFKGEGN